MTSTTRLRLSAVMIVLSAMYAVTVAKDPQIASAIASGYVAAVVTVFVLVNVWKKP
jgi:hypothetical protein